MTRSEHLEWCKSRAFEYIDAGDLRKAWASFQSNMAIHEDTRDHLALGLGTRLTFNGHLSSRDAMRKFIEGIHFDV